MDLKRLKTLIHSGESDTLEFKKSTASLKSIAQTLCAFLNGSGGIVLIGVTDDKRIVGQIVSDQTKRDLAKEKQRIVPTPIIETDYIELDEGKHLIVLNAIADSIQRPYFYNHQAFVRRESSTSPMPRECLQRLMVLSAQHNRHWEEGKAQNARIDDLDSQEVLRTIREGVANRRIPEEYLTQDVEEALLRLRLLKEGQLKNAAMVLFAKHPERWISQCFLKLARFRGTDKKEMIDSRQTQGNAFQLMTEAFAFADRHLPVSSHFPKHQLERVDKPLLPFQALREALVNAIAHRDYSFSGGSINFSIYDNRVEIWNNGSLMPGLSYTDIKKTHESLPRNPLIANILYYRKLFEAWGRGITLIVETCVSAGLPEPEMLERSGGFCVILRTVYDEKEHNRQTVEHLTQRQIAILELVEQADGIGLREIIARLPHPPAARTVQDDLFYLKKQGLVVSIGKGRGARWCSV